MRQPIHPERIYLDFDGFFASVEQLYDKQLLGRPVGVTPFAGTDHTCIIACSREAKQLGVQNVMSIAEARKQCPDMVFVPQNPDRYRRVHNALLSEISRVIPVDAVKSIDELTCRLDKRDQPDPLDKARAIKAVIAKTFSPAITCSMGIAANRLLAKIACKASKKVSGTGYGNGLLIWQPADMPSPLLPLPLTAIPGISGRMSTRLSLAGIQEMADLLAIQPKHARRLWHNVSGERLWYSLHGYDVQSPPSNRIMFGHGRVLPPGHRGRDAAHTASRLLIVKAARRLRREGYYTSHVSLYLAMKQGGWGSEASLPAVNDDKAILTALENLWAEAPHIKSPEIVRLHVTLSHLTPAGERQTDWIADDDRIRHKWEKVTTAMDALNRKYSRTLTSIGPWVPPPGGYAGGKISYTRIPRAEDFW